MKPADDSSPRFETKPIRFAIAQAPLNLDPRFATDAASERVNRLIYQSLVDFDAQSKPVPALARWKVISPVHYRFSLINAVNKTEINAATGKFHHGRPLTSADIVATYLSLKQLKNSPHTAEFANIADIKAIDSDTVDFLLTQPDAQFVAKLILGILPADLIKSGHDFSRAPIGSGPLEFVSWNHKLSLKRVSDQQMIELVEVRDPTVRVLKLIRGEADLLQGDLPPELVKYLQTLKDVQVQTSVGSNFSYLGFNFQDPQLNNPLVRQAIAHAIDRQAIIRQVLVPDSRMAAAILPPEHYTNQATYADYDYDPQLSRRLLKQAGVALPLKLVYKTSTDAQRVRLATIMQAQMHKAGIELEIRSLDWGTFFEDVKQGQFQLYGLTWVGLKTPEIYTKAFASDQTPPYGFNRGRYDDPTLDSLLKRGDWQAATQRIHMQLPYMPLWYEGQFVAKRKDIQDYNPKVDGNWDDLAHIKRSATISYAH